MDKFAIPEEVQGARKTAQDAAGYAGDYGAKSFTIQDELKKVVQEALDYNKDVIGMRSSALSDYLKAPADANVRFGVQQPTQGAQAGQPNQDFIFNPFERNKAINDFISMKEIPFMTANTLLGQRQGTIADTVDAGTRSFQAGASAAQSKATNARQVYSDLLGEFMNTEKMRQDESQFTRNLAQQLQISREGRGGGGGSPVSYQPITVYDENGNPQVVSYNPRTGKAEGRIGGGAPKSKYNETDVANLANQYANGQIKNPNQIPAEIRGDVMSYADQIKQSQPNPTMQFLRSLPGIGGLADYFMH